MLRRFLRPPLIIFAVALVFRLALVFALGTYHFDPAREHYRFGREFGRVARSMASGQGFSSPFHGQTGPTAILPPVYPYLLAGVFKLLGTYSVASAIVVLTLQSLFSALTCVAIFYIGQKSFGGAAGSAAAWVFAFHPFAVYFSVEWVWETALSTLLVSLVFLSALHLQRAASLSAWVGFGLLCGFTALTNPAIVSSLPFLVIWLCWRVQRPNRKLLRLAAAATLVFALCIAPWALRNYWTFHQLILFRSNFGLELRLGNYPGLMGVRALAMHPSQNDQELENYRRMGEAAYIAEKKQEAFQEIERHPAIFAKHTGLRFLQWWTGEEWKFQSASRLAYWGLALQIIAFGLESLLAAAGAILAWRNGNEDAPAYWIVLILYPLVYYLTFPELRFRHPIEPVMLPLCAYAGRHIWPSAGVRSRAPASEIG